MVDGKEIMLKCIDYAKQSFHVPKVGAVIVNDQGEIVGFGFRQLVNPGESTRYVVSYHAEHMAIIIAGEQTKDATLYVTLEPCTDRLIVPPYPKIPSCTDLIIQAGIKKVIFGLYDNNKANSNKAKPVLEKFGIEVEYNHFGLERKLTALLVNYGATTAIENGEELKPFFGGIKITPKVKEKMEESKYRKKPRTAPYKRQNLTRNDITKILLSYES